MLAGRHGVSVDLRLDVGNALGVLLQPGDVDLAIAVMVVSLAVTSLRGCAKTWTDMSK